LDHALLGIQLILSLAIAGGVGVYLIFFSGNKPAEEEKRPAPQEELVRVVGPRSIHVQPNTAVSAKLNVAQVQTAWVTAPVLPVTGTALASLRPGTDRSNDTWQFATPDLLTAFSDWNKAVIDILFQETQLKAIRELSEYRVEAQKKVVAQMDDLVKAGTNTQKELFAEQVNLKNFEIQGKKDIHEAENAVNLAKRTEATLARQLQQAGLEPTMLRSAAAEGDIVVADVPERMVGRVKLDMACDVRFFAMSERVFTAKVSGIAPVISKDKRALAVQFVVKDPEYLIRPGMFAQIGLGTDRRQASLMPVDGVIHLGERDYALSAAEPDTWQIKEVQIGELRGPDVEVLTGLQAGERVLGKGAILLKPVVASILQAEQPTGTAKTN